MYESIFMESNEQLGLLYNSYSKLIDLMDNFINEIKTTIVSVKKDPVSSTDKLKDSLQDLKKDMSLKLKPEAIDIKNIKETENKIKSSKSLLNKLLETLSGNKKEMSFLNTLNFNNDKIFLKEINENQYSIINTNLRNINFSMDYAEKYLLDLFNLTDQDLNILNILDSMYVKTNIVESGYENDLFEMIKSEIFLEEADNSELDDETEEEINEVIDQNDPVNDRSNIKDPKKAIEEEKNGANRKRLYIAFIQYAKQKNKKNLFSSIFDTEAFQETFSFIPESIRYFYRMANPIICIIDDLVFFSLNEIEEANTDNDQKDKYIIIASTDDYQIAISLENEKIYKVRILNNKITIDELIERSFDLWIQNIIGSKDYLNWQ